MSYRIVLVLGAVVHMIVSAAEPTSASPVLDQNFSATPAPFSLALLPTGDSILAETFMVGLGGRLSGADLLVFDATPGFGPDAPQVSDMTVQIRPLLGGFAPADIVIASVVVAAARLQVDPGDQFIHVDFPTGVAVVAGERLALGITGAGIGWRGRAGTQATYPGGEMFVKFHATEPWQSIFTPDGGGVDLLFRTYVDPTSVAEPSTLVLLFGGGALVAIRTLRMRARAAA